MKATFLIGGKEVIVDKIIIKDFFKKIERLTDDKGTRALIVSIEMLALKGLELK